MMVENAVAVLAAWTERLDGSTDETMAVGAGEMPTKNAFSEVRPPVAVVRPRAARKILDASAGIEVDEVADAVR